MSIDSISIYIHIPFCVSKCFYCDFYSINFEPAVANKFLDSIKKEWEIVTSKYGIATTPVETLYYGGGSPSILPIQLWEKHFSDFTSALNFCRKSEVNIECNPESFSSEKARHWLARGVNRLSFGVQSLDDELLKRLGRCHTASKAIEVLTSDALIPFRSIGVDIIYGIAGQTLKQLYKTLQTLLALERIDHISAYELTIVEGTPFYHNLKNLTLPGEDIIIRMNKIVVSMCRKAGLSRYEISNYAKAGHKCLHNCRYWTHRPYIGLGPSAHSFILPRRWANVKDTFAYINLLAQNKLPIDFEEEVSDKQLAQEMIMLGLRTCEGVNVKRLEEETGIKFYKGARIKILEDLSNRGLISCSDDFCKLSDEGMLLADAIIRKLLEDE